MWPLYTIRYFIDLPAHLNYENNHANARHFVVNIRYVVDPHGVGRGDSDSKLQCKTRQASGYSGGQVRSDRVRTLCILCIALPQQNGQHGFVSIVCATHKQAVCLSVYPKAV